MTTNEYIRNVKENGWIRFPGKLWQRNYYEHVIRDEEEWNGLLEYIEANPSRWEDDPENTNRRTVEPTT
jgi:REP element-mobilizing transposase RayT